MATLVLGAVGSAVGGALVPGGLFGTAITGAAIGSAAGAIAGGLVDQALFSPLANASGQTAAAQGPRLSTLKLGTSSEGTVLPRVYGRARLPGELACGFVTLPGDPLLLARGDVASSEPAQGVVKVGGHVERVGARGGFDGMLRGASFTGKGNVLTATSGAANSS